MKNAIAILVVGLASATLGVGQVVQDHYNPPYGVPACNGIQPACESTTPGNLTCLEVPRDSNGCAIAPPNPEPAALTVDEWAALKKLADEILYPNTSKPRLLSPISPEHPGFPDFFIAGDTNFYDEGGRITVEKFVEIERQHGINIEVIEEPTDAKP